MQIRHVSISTYIVLFILLILSGCVTSNYNFFQDGKPSGKNKVNVNLGLTLGARRDLQINKEENDVQEIVFEDDVSLTPLANLNIYGGVTDQIDLGLGLSFGLFTGYMSFFSKFCLFNNTPRVGVALLTILNIGGSPEELFGFIKTNVDLTNASMLMALPISYRVDNKMTIVTRPMYGFEWLTAALYDESFSRKTRIEDSILYESRGLSLGVKFGVSWGYVYPEVSFISFDRGKRYYPYFGIAVILVGGDE